MLDMFFRIGNYSGLLLALCLFVSSVMALIKPYSGVLWLFGICQFIDMFCWALVFCGKYIFNFLNHLY